MQTNESDERQTASGPLAPQTLRLPAPIGEWLRRIEHAGYTAELVGECVLEIAEGRTPRAFAAESTIPRAALMQLAPRALPTGVQSGRITLPTAAGPLDVLPDVTRPRVPVFRLFELRLDASSGALLGSEEAREDLRARRLDVGPSDGLAQQDPVWPLEAARLIAVYGFVPTLALSDRARTLPFVLRDAARARMRRLLRDTLLAPHAREALHWLRETGIEGELVSGVRPEAADLLSRMPVRLRVRLAAWLVDADASHLLRELRFGGALSGEVHRLLELHPINRKLTVARDSAVRKWLKRSAPNQVEDAVALAMAEAELLEARGKRDDADRIRRSLEELAHSIARIEARDNQRKTGAELALSGEQVMQALACEPGPLVGRAIAHLRATVNADPTCNTESLLLEELARWRSAS